jgi:hypothetical protein
MADAAPKARAIHARKLLILCDVNCDAQLDQMALGPFSRLYSGWYTTAPILDLTLPLLRADDAPARWGRFERRGRVESFELHLPRQVLIQHLQEQQDSEQFASRVKGRCSNQPYSTRF